MVRERMRQRLWYYKNREQALLLAICQIPIERCERVPMESKAAKLSVFRWLYARFNVERWCKFWKASSGSVSIAFPSKDRYFRPVISTNERESSWNRIDTAKAFYTVCAILLSSSLLFSPLLIFIYLFNFVIIKMKSL